MCGFSNVWMCVSFVMCGCVCGFCDVLVCVFCDVYVGGGL